MRPRTLTPRACSAAAMASGVNSVGISWVWITTRLTERASPIRPSRSVTRAGFNPNPVEGSGAASTISPSSAPSASPGGTAHSALDRRSVGVIRPPP